MNIIGQEVDETYISQIIDNVGQQMDQELEKIKFEEIILNPI